MKVVYQGIELMGGKGFSVGEVLRITVDYAGRRAVVPLPRGFKGTRDEIGQIVRVALERNMATVGQFDAILPLVGAEWNLPDVEPAAKPKPSKAKKG